ncbi:MAG: hypothetical protein ACPF8V_07175 [Luteibaculum sp.]
MMRRILFYTVLITLYFHCSNVGFSQNKVITSNTWTEYYSNQELTIQTKYTNCEIPSEGLYAEYILLKFKNNTGNAIEVNWYNDTYYDGECTNCDHNSRDRKRTIVLKPYEEITGECGVGLNNGLRVHSKWTKLAGHRELDFLKITEITTTKIDLK